MRKWMSSGELAETITSIPNADALLALYGLSVFAFRALFSENAKLAPEWTDHVVLTQEGKRCLQDLRNGGLLRFAKVM